MRLSYANITSTLALALALGGTGAYAAATIGSSDIKANAVRSTHIKNGQVKGADIAGNAVTSAKVANGSLLASDFKAGEIAKGQSVTVPSGKTLRGTYALIGWAAGSSEIADTGVSFLQAFATAPTAHFVNKDATPPAGCTGGSVTNPVAEPGHLCIYEGVVQNATTRFFFNPEDDGVVEVSKYGFGVYALSDAAGGFFTEGTWAATAP